MTTGSRTSSIPCLYWSGSICIANSYYSTASISCYNNGACNGAGTCMDCSRFGPGGMALGTLSTTDANRLDDSTAATNTQIPIDAAIYNIRAAVQPCCYWEGAVVSFSVDGAGNISPSLDTSTTKCTKTAATDFQQPWYEGSANVSKFPCNGAKPDCPYYTGPNFKYLIDSKMARGEKISAAQIMELRYYSKDWTKYDNPRQQYEKDFSTPDIWAWPGTFDDDAPTESSIPKIKKITLFSSGSSDTFDDALYIGEEVVATTGTATKGGTPNYPTMIKELSTVIAPISIKWPYKSTKSAPFIYRIFRYGMNKIYIIAANSSPYPVYAVNVTKHPRTATTDEQFISDIRDNYPDDLYTADSEMGTVGVIFTVELEYSPELNEIVIFTSKGDDTGSMYTDTAYVQMQFYHAHLAQTSFEDKYGQAVVEPWVDRFVYFTASVSIKDLSVNKATPSAVLWDSIAYDKSTIYEIEKVETEYPTEWNNIYCDILAITLSNTNVNPVQSWKVSGSPTCTAYSSTALGVWVDRSSNPNVTDSSSKLVEMSVLSKSSSGQYFPANVFFVSPKDSGHYGFDKKYDTVKVVFAYTEYKQGPVLKGDVGYLKYPSNYSSSSSSNHYISIMPYKIDFDASSAKFDITGLQIPIYDSGDAIVGYLGIKDFETVLEDIEKDNLSNETKAINSFLGGGTTETSIEYFGTAYTKRETTFNNKYKNCKFGDGKTVTLSDLCSKLDSAGYYDGTQEYRVIFKDETNRPIGIKRLYLLMQSAIPSCRDVEIYYQWKSLGSFVDPRDHTYLLASKYKPLLQSSAYREFSYIPDCGDHSLQQTGQTFYTKFVGTDESISWKSTASSSLSQYDLDEGDKGPMWYPYKSCTTPHYAETDPMTDYLLCSNFVEGFDDSKRRDYWERMRGPDIWSTVTLGIQLVVGCTWSWVDGDYKTSGTPTFSGFTRIRSGHLFAPYQTDREAIRVSRHYIKRNVSVRNELIRSEGDTGGYSLSSEASSRLFYSDGSSNSDEKPIWIHSIDNISVVNRTTPNSKHPFSNILMLTEGAYGVSETFLSTRYTMKEVFSQRDLVKSADRNTNGNLVYDMSEPLYTSSTDDSVVSTGKDIYWVYKDKNTYWTWLEALKDPERAESGSKVTGIFLYNPTVIAWKKDMTPATQTLEETYDLVYVAPTFDKSTCNVKANPTISWASGPPREIDWYTGVLKGSPESWSGGVDPYDESNHDTSDGSTFQLYGKLLSTASGVINGFLADGTGYHSFESGGKTYKTYRGLGVRPSISIYSLPHTDVDVMSNNSAVIQEMSVTETFYQDKSYDIDIGGYKYVKSMTIEYYVGTQSDGKEYYFPQVAVDGQLAGDSWMSSIFYFSIVSSQSPYYFGSQTKSVSLTVSTSRFKKLKIRIDKTPQKKYVKFSSIKLYVRDPVGASEKVKVYEQKVNISTGNTGDRAHKDIYYYYGRTFPSFGLGDVTYEENGGTGMSQDLKWTGRTVRDVLLTYYICDPTGTLYDYPKASVTSIEGVKQADGGPYYIEGPLKIYTKGQTVITSKHVTDPIDAQSSGSGWSDTVAPDECSDCENATSEGILAEDLQECLYKEAAALYGKSLISTFSSFWHPDEVEFFIDTVGISSMPSWTLTLTSYISSFNKVMRHQQYGCDSDYTNEYYDGKVHKIPSWSALGHIVYLGSPVWNWTCYAIIMQKLGKHLGEEYFEISPSDYVSSRTWPPASITDVPIESPSFYMSSPAYWDNPATYTGGSMSPGFPTRISEALNYSPGGYPKGWEEELLNFPLTKSWPLGDTSIVDGYRKYSKS